MATHVAEPPARLDAPAVVTWVLRIALVLQCIGQLRSAYTDGTPAGTTMFITWGWSEATMLVVEHAFAWAAFVASLGALSGLRRPSYVALGFLSAWFAALAALGWYQAGYFGWQFTIPAHATRYLLPLALALWLRAEPGPWPERLLRWAVAATFAAHGVEALHHHPVFIDYLIAAARNLLDARLPESTARTMLSVIGAMDLAVAVAVVTKRWRAVAGWMAFWGLVTAGSRIVHYGWDRWPMFAVRAANFAIPVALVALWWRSESPTSEGARQ